MPAWPWHGLEVACLLAIKWQDQWHRGAEDKMPGWKLPVPMAQLRHPAKKHEHPPHAQSPSSGHLPVGGLVTSLSLCVELGVTSHQ